MTPEEVKAVVTEVIAQRDAQWHAVHEKIVTQVHADLQALERRVNRKFKELRADVGGVVADRRRMNERLTDLERAA